MPYAWSCLACGATNPPAAVQCGRCGCPARATAAQVDAARRTRPEIGDAPSAISGSASAADAGARLRGLPWLPVAAVLLLLLGGLVWMLGTGVSSTAFGALWVALAALCASSYRPRR